MLDSKPSPPTSKTPTGRSTRNARIGTRLIIGTTAKHPYIFALVFPVLYKVFLAQSVLVCWPWLIGHTFEEGCSSSEQSFGIVNFPHVETPLEESCGARYQFEALLDIVDEVDVAVGIGPVHERKLDSGTRVAAVEDDCESCSWDHGAHKNSVELGVVSVHNVAEPSKRNINAQYRL